MVLLHSTNLYAGNESFIKYPSVAKALEKLQSNPSASISHQDGWTVISLKEDGNPVFWYFAPEDHAVHPAMIKKTIIEKEGEKESVIVSFCQAPKQKCDKFTEQFKSLNKKFK